MKGKIIWLEGTDRGGTIQHPPRTQESRGTLHLGVRMKVLVGNGGCRNLADLEGSPGALGMRQLMIKELGLGGAGSEEEMKESLWGAMRIP
jgi:hypothetical protein